MRQRKSYLTFPSQQRRWYFGLRLYVQRTTYKILSAAKSNGIKAKKKLLFQRKGHNSLQPVTEGNLFPRLGLDDVNDRNFHVPAVNITPIQWSFSRYPGHYTDYASPFSQVLDVRQHISIN